MPNEYSDFMHASLEPFLKFAPIVIMVTSAKIAVEIKQKKATIIGSIVSLITGLTVTYLVSPYIEASFAEQWYVLSIGAVAIMSDKLVEFFVFKFDVGFYLTEIFSYLLEKFFGIKKDN